MKKFRLTAVLSALGCALALPTFAADGTSQETKGVVGTSQSAQAQAAAEQPRLPAEKEAASSGTRSPSEMNPGSSTTTTKKSVVKSDGVKSPDQKKNMKHPPTAAMDSATPVEKSTTNATGTSGKNTPTGAMDRATPDQKSP